MGCIVSKLFWIFIVFFIFTRPLRANCPTSSFDAIVAKHYKLSLAA